MVCFPRRVVARTTKAHKPAASVKQQRSVASSGALDRRSRMTQGDCKSRPYHIDRGAFQRLFAFRSIVGATLAVALDRAFLALHPAATLYRPKSSPAPLSRGVLAIPACH